MIKVIEGQEYEEYIKIMCAVMQVLEDKHDLEFYINKDNLRNCIDYREKTVRFYINDRDNKIIQNSIIYLLQKYRFLCCTQNRGNMSPEILELMECYLSNYYSMILPLDVVDFINKNNNIGLKYNNLDGAIKDTITMCKYVIANCENYKSIGLNKLLGKLFSCRNILKNIMIMI